MNKKGFSLSELLVVIAIIAVLTVIAVPSIISVSKNINKRLYKEKQDKIVAAAELYATNNPDIFNGKEVVEIPISELLKSDYLKQDVVVGDSSCVDDSSIGSNGAEGCIINPIDNTSINNKVVTIRKKSTGFTAEFGESSSETETLQNDTLVNKICNSIKKGTITGKWGTSDVDTCECKFDSSGNVTGIYKAGTSTRVNACIIGGGNPNNWLNYGGVEWRVLGLYDISGNGSKILTKIITHQFVEVAGSTSEVIDNSCNLTVKSFEEDEWCTIINAVRTGNTSKYNVGDTKEVDLGTTYGTHTLRIANKSTPSTCSGSTFSQTACGFVIEFADIITYHEMNSTDTNDGGWPSSSMRTFLNNDIYNSLPAALKDGIQSTKVISSYGLNGTKNFTSTDKLYLLTPKEIYTDFSEVYDTTKDYTRTLDYYVNNSSSSSNYKVAKKLDGDRSNWWWLRSAVSSTTDVFYNIGGMGRYRDSNEATNTAGVSPAFRIG